MKKRILVVCIVIPIIMATLGYVTVSSLAEEPILTTSRGPDGGPRAVVTLSAPFAAFALGLIGGGVSLVFGWYAGTHGSHEEVVARELGSVASLALRTNIPNLTLKDLELMLYMKELKRFTIKEIVEKSGLSRQAVWKLVSKLEEQKVIVKQGRSREDMESLRGAPPTTYTFTEQS